MSEQLALALPADTAGQIRQLVKARISEVLAAFDAHNPGLVSNTSVGWVDDGTVPPTSVCLCGMRGTEQEWEAHLAEAVGDALTIELVGLPS